MLLGNTKHGRGTLILFIELLGRSIKLSTLTLPFKCTTEHDLSSRNSFVICNLFSNSISFFSLYRLKHSVAFILYSCIQFLYSNSPGLQYNSPTFPSNIKFLGPETNILTQ